jgi:hypothetical protein
MILTALAKHLRANKTIRHHVGTNGIFRERIPQGRDNNVAIVLSTISSNPFYDFDGEPDYIESVVSVDVIGRTISLGSAVNATANQVRTMISGWHQKRGNAGLWDDVRVSSCHIDNDITDAFTPTDASDEWPYQRSMVLRIIHAQSIPTFV